MNSEIENTTLESTNNHALSLPEQTFLLTVRSLTTLFRTPEALLPPVVISILLLVI
jgi:hypothetical protein